MDEREVTLALFSLTAQNRQLFGSVGAEHENAFDIAGSAWAADEGNQAGIVTGVPGFQQFKCPRQIGHQLVPAGDHHVVRGKIDKARPPALREVISTLPVCATKASHSVSPASHDSRSVTA